MSKPKGPEIPDAPSFQTDPNYAWSQDNLKSQYDYLINGLTTNGGSLSGSLGETINLSPDISRLATERYTAAQEPAYRRGLQDLTNTLEANNQLTGSTTGNVLQNYQNDYMAGLTAANAEVAINDINRALSNRVNLYGMGLNTAQGVGQAGLNNQNQMNQFALQNYENQVAKALNDYQNQQASDAYGGKMAGMWLDPWTASAVGGATGGGTGAMAGYQSGWNTINSAVSAYGSIRSGGLMGGSKSATPSSISGGGESIYNPSSSYVAGSGNGLNSQSMGLNNRWY
jgi:hypothetical protein